MKNLKRKNNKKKGFTLIELIIVLAVMGVIALVAIPSLMGVKDNAKIKTDAKSCQTIERAVNVLVADETIPENAEGTIEISVSGSTVTATVKNFKDGTVATTEAANKAIKTAVENSLRDIKGPQEKNKAIYSIALTNGKPTATTAAAATATN